jgi:hypothetical protein
MSKKAAKIEFARTRRWAPVLDPDSELPFSQADALAIMTPLVAASTVIQMPQASEESRARVASGVLFARNVARWGRSLDGEETEEVEEVEYEGEVFAVGPKDLGSEAVQLVSVTQDRRGVTLSGAAFPLPKLDELTARFLTEGCQRLYAVVATWQSIPAMARWFEADVRDLSAKGESVKLPAELHKRAWWYADDGDTVRAKVNPLSLLHRLAKAWAKVEKAERDAAEAALKRLASPYANTATMLSPVARALHAAMTSPVRTETVGMLEQLIIEAPPGRTRSLASLALDWSGSWGGTLSEHFTPTPMVAKVYACSLAESADSRRDDLSWIQNHEHMGETYFGTASKRKVEEISEAFRELRRIVVLKAGKYVAKDGIGQRLIDAIETEDGKNPRYRHCMLMAAALGLYEDEERDRLGMAKQLVQVPRSLIPVDHRLFPLGLGGAILVRDNLESIRKHGKVVLSQEAFFRGVGRHAEVKKRGITEELRTAAKVFDQGCIGGPPVIRDGAVEFPPSKLLVDAYAQTMANAARFEAASAKAATKRRRSAKK